MKNVVITGSTRGLGSNDMIIEQTILYGTSKGSLTYFTKGMAKELKDSPVKIGRLSPGMMLTDFITKSPTGELHLLHKIMNLEKFLMLLQIRLKQ